MSEAPIGIGMAGVYKPLYTHDYLVTLRNKAYAKLRPLKNDFSRHATRKHARFARILNDARVMLYGA